MSIAIYTMEETDFNENLNIIFLCAKILHYVTIAKLYLFR